MRRLSDVEMLRRLVAYQTAPSAFRHLCAHGVQECVAELNQRELERKK